jgi:hypothetical protein
MHVRLILALVGILSLLAVPVAAADHDDPEASAKGNVHWVIPLPNAFGVEVGNVLRFKAERDDDGEVEGRLHYEQTVEGETFIFDGKATCLVIYDGNRAKIGGVITKSNDATQPPGRFMWFQVFDLGKRKKGPPDRSSLVGFGDEAANEAFCNSPNLPRFGPWDVIGQIKVRP